jgi:hypothetical protein
VQIPDIGTTLLERLTVPVASLAFGLLRFISTSSDCALRARYTDGGVALGGPPRALGAIGTQ